MKMNVYLGLIWGETKKHWFIIISALFLTFLVSSPLVFFPFYAGDRYRGINIAHFGTDEHYYLTRGKEVLEGHNLGQPVLGVGKELEDPTFSKAELFMLLPFKLAGLGGKVDVVKIYNIYNFLGVYILLLLIYSLCFSFSRNRFVSAVTALFVVGGYSIVYNKGLFYNDFNIYGRSVPPYGLQLPLFTFIICLYQIFVKNRKSFIPFAVLLFGVLIYTAFYAWTFALSILGSIFLVYLLKRDFQKVKNAIIVSVGGLIIGLPVFIGLAKLFTSGAGVQLSYFMMSSVGHGGVFSKIGFITLVILSLYFYKNRKDENVFFMFALVLAGWVALNQQIITGKFIQYAHYYWYFIVPLSIVISFYALFGFIRDAKTKNLLLGLMVGVIFLNTVVGQYRSFFVTAEYKIREQDFVPIITELNKQPYGVILTPDNGLPYPMLFTIYTNDDLFWEGHALIHQFPIKHLKDALFVYAFLNKNFRNNFTNYISASMENGEQNAYTALFAALEGFYSGLGIYEYRKEAEIKTEYILKLRAVLTDLLAKEYESRIKSAEDVKNLLESYGVKYVVWDKEANSEWDLTPLKLVPVLSGRNLELSSMPR